jgi:hypothetical protein
MKTVQRFVFLAATSATMLSLVVNPAPAQAGVLFDQGASDLQATFPSNPSSSSFNPGESGDDFSLSSAANITEITWSGIYLFGSFLPTDNFSVRLFNIVNGVPDINPFATLSGSFNRVDSGLVVDPDGTLYNHALMLATPFNIEAGNYLLSIINTLPADAGNEWGWATHNLAGNAYLRVPGGAWENLSGELSFAIEGNTTPIPTPALLPGLIGFGLSVWRKRKAEA